jgi:hypothetical protein
MLTPPAAETVLDDLQELCGQTQTSWHGSAKT